MCFTCLLYTSKLSLVYLLRIITKLSNVVYNIFYYVDGLTTHLNLWSFTLPPSKVRPQVTPMILLFKDTMQATVLILECHVCNKDRCTDAIEEFEIYKAFNTDPNYILNNRINLKSNAFYDTVMRVYVLLVARAVIVSQFRPRTRHRLSSVFVNQFLLLICVSL